MEEGVPQGLQRTLVVDRVQIPGDEHGGQCHHRQKEAQLLAPPDLPEPAAQGQEKQPEVQGKQQGGRGHDQVHPRQGVGGKAGVPAGEAAGAGDGEGVDRRVVQGHARPPQQGDDHQGHRAVDAVEDLGGLGLLGHQLDHHGPRRLRPGQVLGAGSQGGEHRRGQHQHSHAPQPVGEAPPELNALGQGLNIRQNGGPGGGKAGAGLKETVHKGGKAPGEPEGQAAEQAGDHPDKAHDHKALSLEKHRLGRHPGQGGADAQDQPHSEDKGPGALAIKQGHRQREEERGGDHQLHAPHQLEDKTQVHPRPLKEAAEGMGISSS